MTNIKEFIDPKDHEQSKVKSGAIAMIRTLSTKQNNTTQLGFDGNSFDTKVQYCQIKSINKGGLVIRYVDENGRSNDPAELDLLFIQDSICFTYLKNVPVKTIGVSQAMENNLPNHVKTIQRDLRFGEMTLHQESQLNRFINKCTIT